MSTDRCMHKEVVVHMYNGILLSHQKEWKNAICSNMDGSREYHTKRSQKEPNAIWYHLYVDSKVHIYATNEAVKETEADSQMNRLVGAKGWRVGEGWIGSWGLAEANYMESG